MFSQWLLFVCTLLMVSDPVQPADGADSRDNFSFVEARAQYGWQVSAGEIAAFEVATK